MSDRVIEYIIKETNVKEGEARKATSEFFNYIDSVIKEGGYRPLSEEDKAKITIASLEAMKELGKKIAEKLK